MLSISYTTTDLIQWGVGLGRPLHAAEIDQNFYNINVAIDDLQDTRPQPNNVANITVDGSIATFVFDDASELEVPLPVLVWRWRGAWTPDTDYIALDVFSVEGSGLYTVTQDHTSGSSFDPDILVGGDPALLQNLPADAAGSAASSIYDMGLFFPGRLQDVTDDALYAFISPRALLIPSGGDQHLAQLREAPSTADQSLLIYANATNVGSIDFVIGSDTGAVSLFTDVSIAAGDTLLIAPPADADATAAGLSVTFAAQRVV